MKLLIISLAAALLLLNCKKSRITPETALETAVTKRPATVFADNGESFNLIYDQNGQLLLHTAGEVTHYYKPGNDHFLTQLLKTSNEKIIYKNAQRDAQSRIVKLEKHQQGTPPVTIEFTYNSDGYLSKRTINTQESGSVQEFVYLYSAGNLSAIQEYENAELKSTVEFTHYNNKLNTTAVDLFDDKKIGFVTDDQFGKQSKNLIETVTIVTPGEQTNISLQYFYKTDAGGYIHSMELRGNSQALQKYNLIFQ